MAKAVATPTTLPQACHFFNKQTFCSPRDPRRPLPVPRALHGPRGCGRRLPSYQRTWPTMKPKPLVLTPAQVEQFQVDGVRPLHKTHPPQPLTV